MKEGSGETALSRGTRGISGTLVSLKPREERGAGFGDEGSWPKISLTKMSSKREEQRHEKIGYEESTL